MHDLDRTQFESEGYEAPEPDPPPHAGGHAGDGGQGTGGQGGGGRARRPSHDWREAELAAELLELSGAPELEHFLGGLISGAARAAGGFLRSSAGRALAGLLKGAAQQALPALRPGPAIEERIAPDAGARLGLELEGLSAQDREFEVARQFVRFAEAAAQDLATSPPGPSPDADARAAMARAATAHAPGLRPDGQPRADRAHHHSRAGRWVRRGNSIVLLGI
jgi:hypothetical protein